MKNIRHLSYRQVVCYISHTGDHIVLRHESAGSGTGIKLSVTDYSFCVLCIVLSLSTTVDFRIQCEGKSSNFNS